MRITADLHVHSRYSRATSKDMDVGNIALWAGRKGINLVGTGDFTHPGYLRELKSALVPGANGLFRPRGGDKRIHFILTTEVSNVYAYKGKTRRIHSLLLAPSFEAVDRINKSLSRLGRLDYDGRPIFGFNAKDLIKLVMDASDQCMVIPAHAWTPWYSVFGSKSGFDSLEECFDEQTRYIHAIETGLSSDPPMNWRLRALDGITLVSNSDAHSPEKLGREANVFDCGMDYGAVTGAIRSKDGKRFLYTVEFFPQEGKYHFDGHRACKTCMSPAQTAINHGICPVCGKPLTIGVLSRVEELATRKGGVVPRHAIPFKHLIPLKEVIADVLSVGVNSVRVDRLYREAVIDRGVPELDILQDLPGRELSRLLPERVAVAVMRMRKGMVTIASGYDGEYGKISIDKRPDRTRAGAVLEGGT